MSKLCELKNLSKYNYIINGIPVPRNQTTVVNLDSFDNMFKCANQKLRKFILDNFVLVRVLPKDDKAYARKNPTQTTFSEETKRVLPKNKAKLS